MRQALTNNLRLLCWLWIVGSTIVILFHAPVTVTRKRSSDSQVTSTEWIGPFTQPRDGYAYSVTRSSIDFSRLVVVLLAVNFLPAVLLWRHDEVVWSPVGDAGGAKYYPGSHYVDYVGCSVFAFLIRKTEASPRALLPNTKL